MIEFEFREGVATEGHPYSSFRTVQFTKISAWDSGTNCRGGPPWPPLRGTQDLMTLLQRVLKPPRKKRRRPNAVGVFGVNAERLHVQREDTLALRIFT